MNVKRTLFLALSGVLAALPTVWSELGSFAFVSLIPACLLLFEEWLSDTPPFPPRHYYAAGLLFFMTYFITAFHWFTYLWPLDFAGLSPAAAVGVIAAACIGLPLLQSLGFSFLFYGLAWLCRTPLLRRVPLLLPFLFAAGWTVFAYTQTLTWAGVPWAAQLALSQYQHLWFLSSASLFGSYFVTFILAAINACLAYAFLWARRSRKQAPGARRQAYLSTVLAASLLVGNTFLSCLCYAVPAAEGETVRVAVLQGNIASSEKWSSGKNALAIYGDLAREAAAEGATLIVWPETALADYLTGTKLTYVRTLAQETHTTQIVGAFDSVADEDGTLRRTNAFYLIDPTGAVQETRYYKRHLVPFGEYVPMEAVIRTLLPFLSDLEMLRDGSTLIAGTTPSLFQTAQGQIGGLICFDSIYPDLSRESAAAGAELLVLGTNDSWFFDSAAVYMHNGQAVLRAVENGRCVLRAANTGISSIISEKGEILAATEPLVEDYLVADVAYHAQPTLYTQIGDVFVLLCQMFLLVPPAAYLICRLRRRRTCPPQ